MKWLKKFKRGCWKFMRSLCEWNIIISKTTLASMDLMEDLSSFNKNFKDKIKK